MLGHASHLGSTEKRFASKEREVYILIESHRLRLLKLGFQCSLGDFPWPLPCIGTWTLSLALTVEMNTPLLTYPPDIEAEINAGSKLRTQPTCQARWSCPHAFQSVWLQANICSCDTSNDNRLVWVILRHLPDQKSRELVACADEASKARAGTVLRAADVVAPGNRSGGRGGKRAEDSRHTRWFPQTQTTKPYKSDICGHGFHIVPGRWN